MPSTSTTRNRLEKQGLGENRNTWGAPKLNTSLDLIDAALDGLTSKDVGSSDTTLTSTNYAADESRARGLVLTGTLTGNRIVTVPAVEKVYLVIDSTTRGGFTLTIKPSGGTGVALRPGPQWVYSTGSVMALGTPRLDQAPLATASVDFNAQKATNLATPTASTDAVTKAYADGLAFATALPAQTGNAGKFVTTDGTTASWAAATVADGSISTAKIADLNVTTAKIADSNVTTAKIADANVTFSKLSTTFIASASTVAVALTDLVLFGDVSDSNISKKATVEDVLNLAGGAIDVQTFTSSGTWNKPAGCTMVMVEGWGAGGAGGSGRRGAAGSERYGGGGGGGGAYNCRTFAASALGSTETVTIGAGGTGGAAITADSTNGNPGTTGGNSTFGSHITFFGGGLGGGGTATDGPGGGGGGSIGVGGTVNGTAISSGGPPAPYSVSSIAFESAFGGGQGGNTSLASTGAGSASYGGGGGGRGDAYAYSGVGSGGTGYSSNAGASANGGGGGGGGGNINASNTASRGGDGGGFAGEKNGPGGGGTGGATGATGTAGAAGATARMGGGGGGAGSAGASGAGAAGTAPGGGGGGGGASLNGNNSGAGGNGARGEIRVYSW